YNSRRPHVDQSWIEQRPWPNFLYYEAAVNRVFPQPRVTALCTYLLDGSTADRVLDVIHNHHFTLARIAGEWKMIASSNFSAAEQDQSRRFLGGLLLEQDDERGGGGYLHLLSYLQHNFSI